MPLSEALEVIIMYRVLLLIFVIASLSSCTLTQDKLVGESVYFKHINDNVFWEDIVVYGKLQKEVLRKPTSVYHSAFGHSYCMSEEVIFEVEKYIKGSGPDIIKFAQNKIDNCKPLAENIGFGEAILFLSKNIPRGVWSTGNVRIESSQEESQIYKPIDILHFLSFKNFESLLSEHEKPLEWVDWGVRMNLLSIETLDKLKEKGILSYRAYPHEKYGSLYLLTMYKFISVETLLKVTSNKSIN